MVQVEGRMTLCVNRFARKAVSRMTEAPSVTPIAQQDDAGWAIMLSPSEGRSRSHRNLMLR